MLYYRLHNYQADVSHFITNVSENFKQEAKVVWQQAASMGQPLRPGMSFNVTFKVTTV